MVRGFTARYVNLPLDARSNKTENEDIACPA